MKGDRGRRVQKRGPRGEVSMCLRARGHRKEEGTGGRKRKVWKGEWAERRAQRQLPLPSFEWRQPLKHEPVWTRDERKKGREGGVSDCA